MTRLLPFLFLLLFSTAARSQARSGGGGGGDRGVSVAGVGHDRGVVGARVLVVEFGDYGCGFCAKFAKETFPVLDSIYIRGGRVTWKYVPFVTGMFTNAREAAETAECADEQGAFWKMSDLLFEKRKEWMASRQPRALMGRYAREMKLNEAQFSRCATSPAIKKRVAQNDELAQVLGIRGTPTFFVNGRVIPGAIPLDLFKRVIAEAGR